MRARGFTLVELLVVFAIIGLLLAIAVPRYFGSHERAKEAVLRENLHQMREAIQQYYADKGRYPEKLETLATEKYLRSIPLDPITERTDTWVVVPPEALDKGGVYDVRSGAQGAGADGKPFAEL
jgi:general secretion pathway protein G